jgi:hypothetical protein
MSNGIKLEPNLPDDRSARIWRYIDLPKFLSLLDKEVLYFARADLLGDPFEGSITPGSIEDFRRGLSDDAYLEKMRYLTQRLREWSWVSCWHLAEGESAALWRLYARSPGGIAIQSTIERLMEFVPEQLNKDGVYIRSQDISIVHYIDYQKRNPDMNSTVGLLICKRESFRHERELRAVIQLIPTIESSSRPGGRAIDLSAPTGPPGVEVAVRVNRLVERIYVEPSSPDWYFELIKSAIKRYGYDVPCHRSSLDDPPFF